MNRGRGYASVTKGTRPDHPIIRASSTLAQLEAATRMPYRGIPTVPAGAPIYDWRVCNCDWVDPMVDGRTVRQADNPRFEWSEEESKTLKSLAAEVKRLVLLYGEGYFHAKDAFRSFPGFPDGTIWAPGTWRDGRSVHSGGRIIREIKPPHDWKFYGPQLATMTTMRLAGDDVGTWSSCCLLSGRISAELRQLAGIDRPDPRDLYGLQTPAGRPAISGPAYPPGTIPPDPPATDPMGDGVPMGAPARPRSTRAAAAAAAEVLGGELAGAAVRARVVDDTPATGYVLPASLTEAEAKVVGRLRSWAVDWGVSPADLIHPLRLVVTDTRYFLQVRDRPAGFRWHEMSRMEGALVPVVNLALMLNPRVVAVTGVEACKRAISAPGGTRPPATQGGTE